MLNPSGEAQVLRWCVAALSTIEVPILSGLSAGRVVITVGAEA
ncbi:hypothetical protein [Corallococcus llansteffanensis]|nr:hypothetical protein [Corallococcus llansteffanensis]